MDSSVKKTSLSNGDRFVEVIQRRWEKQLEKNAKYTEEIQLNLAEEALDEGDGKEERGCSACRENGRHLLHCKHVLRANVVLCIIDCIMVMVELMLDNAAVREDILAKYGRRWENCRDRNTTSHSGERHRRSSDSSGTGDEFGAQSDYAMIAHYCHYVSEAILILLTIETLARLFCFGKTFFRSKLEVFDAFVVIASLVADSILLDGVTNNPPLVSSSIVNLLLPWRIIRVVNSLIIATRDHEHFKLLLVFKAKRHVEDDLYITSRKLQLSQDRIEKLLSTIRKYGGNTDEVGDKGVGDNSMLRTTPTSPPNVMVKMPSDEAPSYEDSISPQSVTRL